MDILYKKAGERMRVFIDVKRGAITLKEASLELVISYRHAKRLYKKFKMEILFGLMPKKRKGLPWNKTKEVKTHVLKTLSELGIRVINTHVDAPHEKVKVERIFRYLQDRLINEFRIHRIKTIEEANLYLREWIKKHNGTHIHATTGMIPNERFKNSCFRRLSADIDLDDIFSQPSSSTSFITPV